MHDLRDLGRRGAPSSDARELESTDVPASDDRSYRLGSVGI